jgi:methylated-DNA-[protein]-cysteine S-methyltransferase
MTFFMTHPSAVGELLMTTDGRQLTGVLFDAPAPNPAWRHGHAILDDAAGQLDEYFDGQRQDFDVDLGPAGTDFQQTVWKALCEIPYGQTVSYGELARRVGNPKASRAVGLANGRNPISIVVPCHRVIGANGSLTGYGGGLHRKEWLLAHERAHTPRNRASAPQSELAFSAD